MAVATTDRHGWAADKRQVWPVIAQIKWSRTVNAGTLGLSTNVVSDDRPSRYPVCIEIALAQPAPAFTPDFNATTTP